MGERDLLQQLELILETDPLICEIGFLHPAQFTTLSEDSGDSVPLHASITKSADETLDRDISVFDAVQYDKSVFWCSNHRLAISLEVLPQLYSAAIHAYTYARRGYKELINSPNVTLEANFLHPYEIEILKHTGVLLILSCDFTSAWNSRKLVLSKKHILSLFMDEFQLSKLILSNSPKSEYAWSHRRWVIKMIGEHSRDLQEIVEKESELVKEIAEKSKMNYRAWNHRCRLVPHMTKAEVLNELCKSRKWAELHVADNCCFHYRRQLMLRMLEVKFGKQDGETSFNYEASIHSLWQDELKWNELLIQRYIGREALWVHRRFLSQCWIKYIFHSQQAVTSHLEDHHHISCDLGLFLGKEFELFRTCQNISVDGFEDTHVQAQLAASYILWISKQISLPQLSILQDKLREVELMPMLIKICPEKTILWESLLG